jgi:Cu+-exporting ATPase
MKVKCNHCNLEFDKDVMIEDDGKLFCCKGCQNVFHLLNSEGLDSFYDKIGDTKLQPAKEYDNDLDKFDTQSFYDAYVTLNSDGFNEIDLIIEGIHCSACVWLNEKVLDQTDGIVEANINFTNNKAKIVWDDDILKLSKIIDTIRAIGYNAYPYSSSESNKRLKKANQDYFIRMMVAVFASLNIMMLGVAKYAGFFTGIESETKELVHLGEFILSTPVLFYSGWVFFRGAYFGIKNRFINMDILIVVGSLLTYIYSLNVLITNVGESYFDSVTMIITFVLVGKYLEVIGKKSAVDTIDKLKSTIPTTATIIKDDSKQDISIYDIKVGDIIELKAGEKVSVDGVLIATNGSFDESSITGESNIIYKTKGDKVFSGTINLDTTIYYSATKTWQNSTLHSIVTLIEDSLNSKPQIEQMANNISKYFSITILLISLLTFVFWYIFEPNTGFILASSRFEQALIVSIAVIVIACPCALSLATPIASLVGISQMSKKGILFKEAKFIEVVSKADILLLDKTGTITNGSLKVVKSTIYKEFDTDILYSLSSSSNHPISCAIKEFIEDNSKYYQLDNIKTISAEGVVANYKGKTILGGNQKLLKRYGIEYDYSGANSLYIFAIDGEIVAVYELSDTIKDGVKDSIKYIKSLGVEIIMVTGDNYQVASKVAKSVLVDEVIAQIDPIEKANIVQKYKDMGKTVVMVGDGLNDAVALSKADISIAMGNGADISIAVSDIVILNNRFENIKETFRLSNRTFRFIKQNLWISLVYNSITVPLAVFGYVIPLIAALSMSVSSLIVVGNSMRIGK